MQRLKVNAKVIAGGSMSLRSRTFKTTLQMKWETELTSCPSISLKYEIDILQHK